MDFDLWIVYILGIPGAPYNLEYTPYSYSIRSYERGLLVSPVFNAIILLCFVS